jgi:hypothetical protein
MALPTQHNEVDHGLSNPITTQVPSFALPNPIAHEPPSNPFNLSSTFRSVPLAFSRFQAGDNTTRDLSSKKRSAFEDLHVQVDKRVKASHELSAPDSIITSTSNQAALAGITPSAPRPARVTAGDFMGIGLTYCQDQNATPTPAPIPSGASATPISTHTKSEVQIPPVPVEAISTLQQASTHMLKALVKKDDIDRENKLMVAVGTMRTCLDIHFVPHMDVWKEDAAAAEKVSSKKAEAVVEQTRKLSIDNSKPPGKFPPNIRGH